MNLPLNIPKDVPKDIVIEYDVYGVKSEGPNYHLAVKKLQDDGAPDIFWSPLNGGHWVAARADVIREVLNDPAHFSSNSIVVPKRPEDVPKLVPIQVDPPNHTKYRNLIAPFLSPKAINKLAEDARALSTKLIDGFKDKGECEFISEFATHLPVAIFMQIAGIPESERKALLEIGEAAMRGESEEERVTAFNTLGAIGMKLVRERRGKDGTDLISAVANAVVDGEPIDDFTLTGMVTLFLLAGLDTVASTMGFAAHFLATHPEHRKQLADDPTIINSAVEELLRRFPVATLGRELKEDYEFHGLKMKKGDMILLPTALDGLDDRKWEMPAEVDFKREGTALHSAFGGGVHRCMGSMLARVELRIFLEEWVKRIPDFEVKPGAEITVKARGVATVSSLPLVWKV